MSEPRYLHRPTGPPPSVEQAVEVTGLDRAPLGAPRTTTYERGREPRVWVWTGERLPAPGWQQGVVVAKQVYVGGRTAVVVSLGLDGGGYTRVYWWGQDSVVAAAPA